MGTSMEAVLSVDISDAVRAATAAAVNEITKQVDVLMAAPATAEREAASDTSAEFDREMASQLLGLRIELAAGLDPVLTVMSLRRWGATWDAIARAAGTSRQAAHERWGRRVNEILDRYGTGELGGPVQDDERDLQG